MTDRVFELPLGQSNVSAIRLFITDRHGRPLGRGFNDPSLTATGTGTKQSELGNLNFSCVIRADVVQISSPNVGRTPEGKDRGNGFYMNTTNPATN